MMCSKCKSDNTDPVEPQVKRTKWYCYKCKKFFYIKPERSGEMKEDIINIIGVLIILDGIASVLWAFEPRFIFQVGRAIRIVLGIILLII